MPGTDTQERLSDGSTRPVSLGVSVGALALRKHWSTDNGKAFRSVASRYHGHARDGRSAVPDGMQHAVIFPLVTISATTLCSWFWFAAVADKCKSAVTISGLATFIAANHYMRIFNSWWKDAATPAGLRVLPLTGTLPVRHLQAFISTIPTNSWTGP